MKLQNRRQFGSHEMKPQPITISGITHQQLTLPKVTVHFDTVHTDIMHVTYRTSRTNRDCQLLVNTVVNHQPSARH